MKIVLNKKTLLVFLIILVLVGASFWYLKNENVSVDDNKEIFTENIVYTDEEKSNATIPFSFNNQKNIEN